MNISWQTNEPAGKNFAKAKESCHCLVSFGRLQRLLGSKAVIENPILKEIATSKGKTVVQIAGLRWIHEQGASLVVKSFNKERMEENLQIFDWNYVSLNWKRSIHKSRSGDCIRAIALCP